MLACLLLLSCLLLGSELLDLFDMDIKNGVFSAISISLDLLFGPLIWWMLLVSIREDRPFKWTDLLHFLSFLFIMILAMTVLNGPASQDSLFGSTIPDSVALVVTLKIGVLGSYTVAIYRKLKQATTVSRGLYRFLSAVVYSLIGILVVGYGTFLLMFIGIDLFADSDFISSSLLTGFIYLLTIMILLNPALFFWRSTKGDKYAKSGLSEVRAKEIEDLLTSYFKEQKPYLDENLTLSGLARGLEISTNNLSQVINGRIEKSFSDLVNEYRVAEVKEKLLDPGEQHKKIIAIAFECGFQSKASFNRVFKNLVGMTPVEFQNRNRS